MNNIAILDPLWGDNGKGGWTHKFSPQFDWVVKCAGGNNCGHTLYYMDKKYVHHLVPSINFEESDAKGFISCNTVIDLQAMYDEIIDLEKSFKGVGSRLYVDVNAHVVTESHKTEDREANKHIGTTGKGIGPCYRDKINRSGTRIKDLFNNNDVKKLKEIGVTFTTFSALYDNFMKSKLLFEGSQGILLDIDHGTYPYVTSSQTNLASIVASGFANKHLLPNKVFGVAKCYATRVGNGPFPSELMNDVGEKLRELGKEYGATTGRPRRVGWLDIPLLNYSCRVSGITNLIFTKFDVLNNFDDLHVVTHYKLGEQFVSRIDDLDIIKNKTVNDLSLEKVSKWNDASNIQQLKSFFNIVDKYVDVPVEYISFGTKKEDFKKIG
ncbi:MAG: adenylosuccinate synthetase [Chitinophagales bacterium]|nr:adenylosuccinate synthetase [Chitinophagales bacterium]